MLVNIAEYFPLLHRDCKRDLSRLLSLIESRGLPFLMIDLPDAGKHFDGCLSRGYLDPFKKPGLGPFRRGSPIPKLFKGLVLCIFDESGLLRDDPDIQAIRFLRQLFYAAKKTEVACDDSKTYQIVNEFFMVDREVRESSLRWDDDEFDPTRAGDLHLWDHLPMFDLHHPDGLRDFFEDTQDNPYFSSASAGRAIMDVVQRTADVVASSLGGFDPADYRAKHGPGAVADQRGTQFKYHFPSWPAKLEKVFPMADFGFANFASWAAFSVGRMRDTLFRSHEYPSKLIAVPKTLKGPRLIASEPVSHQWCQQIIMDFMVNRLDSLPIASSIHFRDQTYNQELARQASHSQSHVTIDLSSASDRLSCSTVERVFRRNPTFLHALQSSRTRWVLNRIDKKSPEYHKLRKFACMGSACTFPVQSYVFSILAIGTLLATRGVTPTLRSIRRASKEVLVFGDDMIVPWDMWEVFQGVLGYLQLKVNPAKTYDTGRFRESCGLDAFDGHDVTPVYSITYPDVSRPGSIISCVDTHNNFLMGGWDRVAAYIRSRVPRERYPVLEVPIGSGCFGWYSYAQDGNHWIKSRWNAFLQRTEYLTVKLKSKRVRKPVEDDSALLQFFTGALRRLWHPYEGITPISTGVELRSSDKLVRGWVNPN